MIRVAEALMMFSLFLVVFFAGVNYSDAVKSKASWLFEKEAAEVDLTNIKEQQEAQDSEDVAIEQEEEFHDPIYAQPIVERQDFESEVANQQPDINDQIPIIPAQ